MEFIMNNWYVALACAAIIAVGCFGVYRFFQKPTEEQLNAVYEWLLGAVIEAEKALGSGTGQLKLHRVYDLFLVRFPWVARIIPFNVFSDMVDDALEDMRELLEANVAVQDYVGVSDHV